MVRDKPLSVSSPGKTLLKVNAPQNYFYFFLDSYFYNRVWGLKSGQLLNQQLL